MVAPQVAADAVNGLNVQFRLGVRFGHVAFPTGISTGECIYASKQHLPSTEIAE